MVSRLTLNDVFTAQTCLCKTDLRVMGADGDCGTVGVMIGPAPELLVTGVPTNPNSNFHLQSSNK